ncbi:MAG: hypothetical protein RML75_18400 [Cyanobacteriota bacterium SKYGB_h_bin112]|nr:hypothetical protein [Cyanobacteriota bacterium SKYGB_h_bin112]
MTGVVLNQLLPMIYPDLFPQLSCKSDEPANLMSIEGLRQRELCDRLGLSYKVVAQAARQLGLSTHAYLQQQTGWILRDERYYPPGTQFQDR